MDAVGQQLDLDWRGSGPIVGVVRDFHFESLHNEIGPQYRQDSIDYLFWDEIELGSIKMTPSGKARRQPNEQRSAYPSISRKTLNRFVGGPHRISHKPEIDERRQIAIALRNLCCGGCVLDDGDLKTLLQ